MARYPDEAHASIPAHLLPIMIHRVNFWLRLTGYAPNFNAEGVLDTCMGTIWLRLGKGADLESEKNWTRALRHALYMEFERGRRSYTPFDKVQEVVGGEFAFQDVERLPLEWTEWVAMFDGCDGHPARIAKSLGWTHRQMRVHLSSLYRELTDDQDYENLACRVRRILHKLHSHKCANIIGVEARLVHRLLGWLEVPRELKLARKEIKTLVRKKYPVGSESPADANASAELRATE